MAGTDGVNSRSLPRSPKLFNQPENQLDSHTSIEISTHQKKTREERLSEHDREAGSLKISVSGYHLTSTAPLEARC